jgi:hypothetical protein
VTPVDVSCLSEVHFEGVDLARANLLTREKSQAI